MQQQQLNQQHMPQQQQAANQQRISGQCGGRGGGGHDSVTVAGRGSSMAASRVGMNGGPLHDVLMSISPSAAAPVFYQWTPGTKLDKSSWLPISTTVRPAPPGAPLAKNTSSPCHGASMSMSRKASGEALEKRTKIQVVEGAMEMEVEQSVTLWAKG